MQSLSIMQQLSFEIAQITVLAIGIVLALLQIRSAVRQLKLSTKQHSDNHDWNRRIATHSTLLSVYIDKICLLRDSIVTLVGQESYHHQTYNEAALKLEKKEIQKLDQKLLDLLTYYTFLAQQIRNNVLDEEIAYQLIAFSCISAYKWGRPFIDEMRASLNQKHLFIDLENLSSDWLIKMERKATEYRQAVDSKREYKSRIA